MNKFSVSALCAALLFSAPAFAFDDSDKAAVKATFDTLITGMSQNDFDAIMGTMSPAIVAKMAEPTGMTPEAFKELAAQQMAAAMAQVKIEEVTYDLDGMKTGTSESGRDYAVVMTTTVMDMAGSALTAVAPALAFEDDSKWYVVQVQSPEHAALLAEVYPDLADVELPEPEMKVAE